MVHSLVLDSSFKLFRKRHSQRTDTITMQLSFIPKFKVFRVPLEDILSLLITA